MGTKLEVQNQIIDLAALIDKKSTLAKSWLNRRAAFENSDLPIDLEQEFIRIAGDDERYDKYKAVKVCDWLLTIETGLPVGYQQLNLIGVVNAALGTRFGKQIAQLLLRAIQEFQPDLLKRPWVEKHVAEAETFCRENELPIFGQSSWVEKLRCELLPHWDINSTKAKYATP